MWVGRRPSLDEMAALCGIRCAAIDELAERPAQERGRDRRPGAARRRRDAGPRCSTRSPRGRPRRTSRETRTTSSPSRCQRAAAGQGRVRDRRDARGLRRRRPKRSRRSSPTCPRRVAARPRRALGRGRLRAARPPRRQRRRLRHDRRRRRPRLHAALDPQRRRPRAGDLLLLDAGRRARHALHRRRHPDAAGLRGVQRRRSGRCTRPCWKPRRPASPPPSPGRRSPTSTRRRSPSSPAAGRLGAAARSAPRRR